MKVIKRKSIGTHFSMCVQPAFIIGTNNEDGTHNFAPITWVSITNEKENDYLLIISMSGTKRTKQNVNGLFWHTSCEGWEKGWNFI